MRNPSPELLEAFDWLKVRRMLATSRAALAMLGALVAGVFVWAAVSNVNMIVRAEGRVVPSSKSQLVQHLEGGVILALNVAESDMVRRGDVLASIRDVRASAQLGERKVRVEALVARIARLKAEASGALRVELPAGVHVETQVLESELNTFAARRQGLEDALRMSRDQVVQKQAELAEQKSRRASLVAEAEVARNQLQISDDLLSRAAASKLELLDAQSRLQRLRTMIADTESAVPRINAAIAEAQSRLRETESKFRAAAQTDLTSTRTELGRLDEEMKGESDRVDRTELKAPVSGIVNRVYVNTVGGVVKPGEPVMEITPMDGKIVVEAKVKPADRAELRVGLPTHVRLSAYDYASYGAADGVLTEVSADTVPDERGERYYRVRVSLDGTNKAFAGRPIVPGMNASAEILVGRRTVMDYLTSPMRRFARTAFSEPR